MKSKLPEEESPIVEMAPMIDCVFLMLIFFLIAATIRKKHLELPVELPSGHSSYMEPVTPEDDTLVITVMNTGDGLQYAAATIQEQLQTTGGAREMMTWDQLVERLRLASRTNPNRRVRIDADVSVPYGRIAQLIDHLELYQLRAVGLRVADPARQ